jgi:hypothetical protein
MKLGDEVTGQVRNPSFGQGSTFEREDGADSQKSARQLELRGLNRQYESEDELKDAIQKAYHGVEVETIVVTVKHDEHTMENQSWAVLTMKTEQHAQVVLESPQHLPGKITATAKAATDAALVGRKKNLWSSAVGEYKKSKLHGQAGWSQARKDIPLHMGDRPEHGDTFTVWEQLLMLPNAVFRVVLVPAFFGQLPFTIALAGEQRRCVIPGHYTVETMPCANVQKWSFVYFTCPLWLFGAIFMLMQFYKLQLTDVGFGDWQHYAFIVVCSEMTFLISEELVWEQFQPEDFGTVILAHMSAIMLAIWPILVLASYLIQKYNSRAQEVQKAHGEEWS